MKRKFQICAQEQQQQQFSASSSASSQSAQNQQVAVSGSGTAIGAGSTVASGGPAISVGSKSSAKINYSSTYVDNSTDANDALAFETIDHLTTAASAAAQASLAQAQQGTSGTSSTGATAPIYVPVSGGGDATGSGLKLTPTTGFLILGGAVALIYILKR